MDVLDAIHTRRSVREFTDQQVDDDAVEVLLKAAMAAPSANNGRPWRFLVLRDSETRKQIDALRPGQAPLVRAPLGIVVLADAAHYTDPWWAIDCSLAAENLILAAQSAGLGTVWIGVWPDSTWVSGVARVLGLEEGMVPFAIIAVGHPGRQPAAVDRYNPDWVLRR